jgi:hypothetical protein
VTCARSERRFKCGKNATWDILVATINPLRRNQKQGLQDDGGRGPLFWSGMLTAGERSLRLHHLTMECSFMKHHAVDLESFDWHAKPQRMRSYPVHHVAATVEEQLDEAD